MNTVRMNAKLLFFATFTTVLFLLGYIRVYSTDYIQGNEVFQEIFTTQEKQLSAFLEAQVKRVKQKKSYSSPKIDSPFFLHIYKANSLVYWNTNQLPVTRFADRNFPKNGIVHLQNGWYYAKTKRVGSAILCASFLIKTDFSYENEHLSNQFTPPFYLNSNARIVLNQSPNYAIRDLKGNFLFSLESKGKQPIKEWESQLLLFLLLTSLFSWLYNLFYHINTLSIRYQWAIAVGVFLLRIVSLQQNWFGFLRNSQAFEASLYGTDRWFPNFFEYLLNSALIFFYVFLFKRLLEKMLPFRGDKVLVFFLFIVNYFLWSLLIYLNKGLIENSSIPLTINRLFSINSFSFLAIFSTGVLFYAFFVSTKTMLGFLKKVGFSTQKIVVFVTLFGLIYFVVEYFYSYKLLFSSIFPLIFNLLTIFFIAKERKSLQLGYGLSFLTLFSLVSATNFAEFNERKEKSERELYANKLANERDIVTEVEFSELKPKIQQDNALKKIILTPGNMKMSTVENILERRLFAGFWERYELKFNLFDSIGKSYIDDQNLDRNAFANLNEIIENHSQVSEIDSSIFFVKDYKGQFSYIIRLPIKSNNGSSAILFCALKSKKIPEEIGFPRLLISSKEQVLGNLLHYSIARYHSNRLVATYGRFNYPSTTAVLKTWNKSPEGYANVDGYNHFILEKTAADSIVLSSKETTWVGLATWFSYLVGFYGILLLPLLFQFEKTLLIRKTLSLAVKIQLALIGLIFVALFAFGWGSGAFIQHQYTEFSDAVLREKLTAVQLELKEKIVENNSLAISNNGNQLEYLLQTVGKIFATDINLYDTHGFLIASSRPKIFSAGLISDQINPIAYNALLVGNKSEITHEEKIGKLSFTSAYLPFYSNNGHLLGFLNLQHFGRQKEFQDQLQDFLVSIINVFMVLLAVSMILTIFISNWLTAPLRLLQENFSTLRFGKKNQRISYSKEDEIGALVKDYNKKLDELEFNAQQLAQSERESAWREMAKQVAHEIKNPLTPMKLSVQHLLRVYNPADANSELKLQRVATSIIEQIDSLTHIANEFSNFAKMPRLEEISLDLVSLIENVVEVFREEKNCEFTVESTLKTAIVLADKDQMIRTFNNLLKNALQAIPEKRIGKISVRIIRVNKWIKISVSDNGVGIPSEQRSKLFVPYFTTKSNGSGLGLPIVKQIIENHRGVIYVQTMVGFGTTFIIELPTIDEEN